MSEGLWNLLQVLESYSNIRLLRKMIPRHLCFKGQMKQAVQPSKPISATGNLPQWPKTSGNTNRAAASDSSSSLTNTIHCKEFSPAIPYPTPQVAQGPASHPVLHVQIRNQSPRQREGLSQVIATSHKNLGVKRSQTWAFSKACKSELFENHIWSVPGC